MATTDYTNSVPLGQAGTGAAYVLPQSQAAGNIDDFIQARQRLRQQQLIQQQRQAQQLAAAWKDNQLKIKGGSLFQPEINERAQKVMEMGFELQKAGINPNGVGRDAKSQAMLETYQTEKAALMRDADLRDEIVKQSQANEKLLAGQSPGYFNQKSVQDYHDYIGGKVKLSDISANGLQMPELRKAFQLQELVEKLPETSKEISTLPVNGIKRTMVVPNEKAHLSVASGLVNNNPEVQADIEAKAGVPFAQIGSITNPAVLKKQLDDYYRSAENVAQLAQQGISSYQDPKYDQFITEQAVQQAGAAKVKQRYIDDIKVQLDNRVDQKDRKEYDFEYQKEQDRRERLGMERQRFSQWKQDQQEESGTFTLGNQDTFVPVIQQKFSKETGQAGPATDRGGNKIPGDVKAEAGASLYGVNLPAVRAVVRPSLVTDMKTGKTTKNTSPIDVEISQIQMVPVFKNLGGNDPRNGSEISARQLKEIVTGKHKFGKLHNIAFQPYAYGIKSEKDGNNVHTINTPIKFSYDALKGSNVKKINTTTFDEATQSLKLLQANPKFQQMTPEQQLEFISQKYNVKLD